MDYSFFNGMNNNSEPDTGLGGSGSQPAGGAAFNPYAPPAASGGAETPVSAAVETDAALYSPGAERGSDEQKPAAPVSSAPAAHAPYAPPVFQEPPHRAGEEYAQERPHRAGEEYVQETPHRAGEGLLESAEAVNPAPKAAVEEIPAEPEISGMRPQTRPAPETATPEEPDSMEKAAPAVPETPSPQPVTPPAPPVTEAPAIKAEKAEKPVQKPAAPASASAHLSDEEVRYAHAQINKVVDNVETAIIGKRTAVELVFLTMLARGHALLEDVPGVGKTSLVSAIAKSVACDFKRIQFTPDQMPSDITGFSIYNQKSGEFEFRSGAAMSNIVLADEINRASAKTQSAMLEIMEEKQVTVDSQTYTMEEPFFVMATQNPVESFGTYPLPEAQIDRFMIKLSIGYPKIEEEQKILHSGKQAKTQLRAVISKEEVLELRDLADRVWVDPSIERYMVEIVAATRANAKIVLGSSPRGSISLNNAAKVYALFCNRGYVIPDDVKYLAPYILAHRIILSHDAKNDQTSPTDLINEIVSSIVAPR